MVVAEPANPYRFVCLPQESANLLHSPQHCIADGNAGSNVVSSVIICRCFTTPTLLVGLLGHIGKLSSSSVALSRSTPGAFKGALTWHRVTCIYFYALLQGTRRPSTEPATKSSEAERSLQNQLMPERGSCSSQPLAFQGMALFVRMKKRSLVIDMAGPKSHFGAVILVSKACSCL